MSTCFEHLNGKKLIIGLSHLKPLPGTPFYEEGNLKISMEKAVCDCVALKEGGADGALIQTFDILDPHTDDTDYIRVASVASIASKVRAEVGRDFLLGVQIMWNCITPSLAVCRAVHADFTRCSCYVGESKSAAGTIYGKPLEINAYRKKIGAENIGMSNEIYGYHIKGDYDAERLKGLAFYSEYYGAQALEVMHKDEKINEQMVKDAKSVSKLPVILGGSTNVENCKRRLRYADGAYVGGAFQENGMGGIVKKERVLEYMQRVRELEDEMKSSTD